MIDGFFPENGDIFPVKAWKRRLDYIEIHLGDIEKKIIELDAASARKDVIEITKILSEIDYNFISEDDLEHIINGIIIPALSNKNRIEDKQDIYAFIYETLELLQKRAKDIEDTKMKGYLLTLISFLTDYRREITKEDVIHIYDGILEICRGNERFEQVELIVLEMKSDISDTEEKISLQNYIIDRGVQKIDDVEIARVVLVAINEQIEQQKNISEKQKKIMDCILQKHNSDMDIQEAYYDGIMEFYSNKIPMEIEIDEFVNQLAERKVAGELLLRAYCIQCENHEEPQHKVDIATKAIAGYDYNGFDSCRECLAFSFLLRTIIICKIKLGLAVEQRYIDLAIKICYKEERCYYVAENLTTSINAYIDSINSQFEKRELCKKALDICIRSEMYIKWVYFCEKYIDNVDQQEKEEFLLSNDRFKQYMLAKENVSTAIDEYVNNNKEICKNLLLDASESFEEIFEGNLNPALVNICFMARRGEIPGLEISVLDVLNTVTWMGNDAFLNINKALSYLEEENWEEARREIKAIDSNLSSAIEWWSQEQVVGKVEKNTVLLLLLLENKIDENIEEINVEELWEECKGCVSMPEEIKNEVLNLSNKSSLGKSLKK